MKVYGLFKNEMMMPFLHETLINLYASKDEADVVCMELNRDNPTPLEADSYGPISGCEYFVIELEVIK